MHVHIILAAATATSGTENYPYILGLLAVIISLVAILQVSGLRKELHKTATPPSSAGSAQTAKAPVSAQPAAADGIAPEIVAAIDLLFQGF